MATLRLYNDTNTELARVTITDARVTRVRAAYGTGGIPATAAEFMVKLRDQIANYVKTVEKSTAVATAIAPIDAEDWTV